MSNKKRKYLKYKKDIRKDIKRAVKVKLSEKARKRKEKEIEEFNEKFNENMKIKIDDDGYYNSQLWCLMADFGDMIGLAKESPFINCKIIIDVKYYTCSECNNIIAKKDKYCRYCGQRLK